MVFPNSGNLQYIRPLKQYHITGFSPVMGLPRGNHVKTVSCRATVITLLTGRKNVIGGKP